MAACYSKCAFVFSQFNLLSLGWTAEPRTLPPPSVGEYLRQLSQQPGLLVRRRLSVLCGSGLSPDPGPYHIYTS